MRLREFESWRLDRSFHTRAPRGPHSGQRMIATTHSVPSPASSLPNIQSGQDLPPSDGSLRDLALELDLEYVELSQCVLNPQVIGLFPTRILFRDAVLPLDQPTPTTARIAVADPFNLAVLDELTAATGLTITMVVAERREIEARLHQHLGVGGGTVSDLMNRGDHELALSDEATNDVDAVNSEASVVKLVNELLAEALTQGASDVHLEPRGECLDVRFRVDGQLRVQPTPAELHRFRAAIVSRLKIMAKLNIAEKRLPQDGRIKLHVQGREIDVRVSVIPMLYGEGVVMRLLDRSRTAIQLEQMRFPSALLTEWRSAIRRPHGMVLVTGPTGSGKTTTLYASLAEIRRSATKIITIEDPVEYHLDGVCQIQVHNKVGLTFAAGLRSILRHDPDVVLIGEIRDTETAVSAVQASLTGHLVFSTLHTNDAASAFTRLTDMGIEPYLVASTVHAVLAQRLVRRLCTHCRKPVAYQDLELPADLPIQADATLYEAVGCRHCHGIGYAGRLAIFELLQPDNVIRKMCIDRCDAPEIKRYAARQGMQSLRTAGWRWVLAGETTIDEVLRAAADDDIDAIEPAPVNNE